MYIVCIYNAYFMYITKNYIVYTENLDSIYIGYSMYMLCIVYVYFIDIHKLNMEMLPAGQGRGTSLATHTVSSRRLDEIDGLQCSDIVPKGQAA
jgi:hypothetical protein